MTELQLLQLRFNELESTLLKLNVAERLLECERRLKAINNGDQGFYPSKRMELLESKVNKVYERRKLHKNVARRNS